MKQKRQIGILFILLVGAAIVWGWNFRDKRVVTADASPNLQDAPISGVENPHIRIEQIESARKAEYKGSGRNPFSSAAAPAPVTQAPKGGNKFQIYDQPQPKAPPPPPPPCILPANVKFYGYGSVNGASRHAYFTDEEGAVQIVGEGDVLLKRFRIVRISNANLEFEEISRGCIGQAPLEEQPPGPQQ